MEKELESLKKDGIIEPIRFAEWTAPIVSALNSDKTTVRICGDFRMTINQVSRLDNYPIPKIDDLFATLAGGKSRSRDQCAQT